MIAPTMADAKTPEPADAVDEALLERLKFIVSKSSQADLARKTGTSQQNVNRYLQGARMPAAFMTQLVAHVGVNPAWLLTGEGTPFLSDVSAQTKNMAGDLLELVEAMNAVTTMRLGALAGKQHLKMLRELNDALVKYEALKDRMHKHSDDIFRQILADMEITFAKRDVDQSEALVKAAMQVSRLSEDEALQTKLLNARAWLHYRKGEHEQAVALGRLVHLRSMGPNALKDSDFIASTINHIMSLRQNRHLDEALRVCRSTLELFDSDMRREPMYAMMQHWRGNLEIDTGRLFDGLSSIEQALPNAPAEYRESNRCSLMRAQLMAGILTFEQAASIPIADFWRPIALIQFALMMDDRAMIAHAHKHLVGSGSGQVRADDPFAIHLDCVHRAYGKDQSALKDFEASMAVPQPHAIGERRLAAMKQAGLTAVAQILGDDARARKSFAHECAAFSVEEERRSADLFLFALHHANALRLFPDDTCPKEHMADRERALAWFRRLVDNGYQGFRRYVQPATIRA